MKIRALLVAAACLTGLSACVETKTTTKADACGASKYQHLVGGPSLAASKLNIPGSSRHYGKDERIAMNNPSRLNILHSGTAVESVTDPKSRIVRVFCG